jgi:hypothetical protein
LRIDAQRVYALILRELNVVRPVWESYRLLDQLDEQDEPSFVDEFVKFRTSQGLAYVFALLSLVLPAEPLQAAYRGLHVEDDYWRGFALEYLGEVLPAAVRDRLWPFLDNPNPISRAARPREEIVQDLLQSNASMIIDLAEIRKRAALAGVVVRSNPDERAWPKK